MMIFPPVASAASVGGDRGAIAQRNQLTVEGNIAAIASVGGGGDGTFVVELEGWGVDADIARIALSWGIICIAAGGNC